MRNDLEEKNNQYCIYSYNFAEICKLYTHISFEKRKKFKDCIAHFLLAKILRKGGYDKYADILESISMLEMKKIDKKMSKIEFFLQEKEYSLKIKRLFGLNGIINKYKISEFVNGEWLLKKLIDLTIGSSYEVDECEDLSFVNIDSLTEEDCHAIGENFQRNMRNEELVFYKSKRLEKKENLHSLEILNN